MQLNKQSSYSGPYSDELIEDLKTTNNFLLKLVDTIPAHIYFDDEIREKITSEKHSMMDNRAEELKRKSQNHFKLSIQGKHKRARLDPLCQKTVSQIQMEMEERDNKRAKRKNNKTALSSSVSVTRASNVEELQKRLKERIDELRKKRKAGPVSSPLKEKKKKSSKEKKKKEKLNLKNKDTSNKSVKNVQQKQPKQPAQKPVFNKDAKLLYGKLDFSEDGVKDEKKKHKLTGKNYKELLKKVEKKQEKLESMKSSDPDKAVAAVEKEKWNRAILKSENVKLKDDPGLLKKASKRKEKIKQKQTKAWNERKDQVESKKKARQDKRDKNIKERKRSKLEHKLKHAKKKGRVITGF